MEIIKIASIIIIILFIIVLIVAVAKPWKKSKEGFFNTGLESVSVNKQGTLEGPTIFTNGQLAHGLKYDDIVKDVKEGKQVSDGGYAGAGKGTGFEDIYQEYVKNQTMLDQSPTGVRSMDEMQELTKSINGNMNMAKENLLTRAGASRAKVVLNPTGTVGVMEDNASMLPEREHNPKIYAASHVIKIPTFKFDSADIYKDTSKDENEISLDPSGISQVMKVKPVNVITSIGEDAVKSGQVVEDTAPLSFSEAN